MSESFAQLFEESLNQTEMTTGQVVIGTVTDIRDGYVIVSAGLKSEGVIPDDQFKSLNGELEVAIGDDVDVVLEITRNFLRNRRNYYRYHYRQGQGRLHRRTW